MEMGLLKINFQKLKKTNNSCVFFCFFPQHDSSNRLLPLPLWFGSTIQCISHWEFYVFNIHLWHFPQFVSIGSFGPPWMHFFFFVTHTHIHTHLPLILKILGKVSLLTFKFQFNKYVLKTNCVLITIYFSFIIKMTILLLEKIIKF